MCRGDTQRNLIVKVQEMKAQGNQQRTTWKTSETGYKCVCLNARSIVNKRNELNIMVEDTDPHIIGITESWANKDILDA
jgi:hypothetical protein